MKIRATAPFSHPLRMLRDVIHRAACRPTGICADDLFAVVALDTRIALTDDRLGRSAESLSPFVSIRSARCRIENRRQDSIRSNRTTNPSKWDRAVAANDSKEPQAHRTRAAAVRWA